jgi:hypothetical protein
LAELVPAADHPGEGVLNDVLGLLVVAQDPPTAREQGRRVTLVQVSELSLRGGHEGLGEGS